MVSMLPWVGGEPKAMTERQRVREEDWWGILVTDGLTWHLYPWTVTQTTTPKHILASLYQWGKWADSAVSNDFAHPVLDTVGTFHSHSCIVPLHFGISDAPRSPSLFCLPAGSLVFLFCQSSSFNPAHPSFLTLQLFSLSVQRMHHRG